MKDLSIVRIYLKVLKFMVGLGKISIKEGL